MDNTEGFSEVYSEIALWWRGHCSGESIFSIDSVHEINEKLKNEELRMDQISFDRFLAYTCAFACHHCPEASILARKSEFYVDVWEPFICLDGRDKEIFSRQSKAYFELDSDNIMLIGIPRFVAEKIDGFWSYFN